MKMEYFRPEGMDAACGCVEELCARVYSGQEIPRRLMVNLEGEDDRTRLMEHMADLYQEHRVLPFEAGVDDYLILRFEGSLRQMFQEAEDASVYANSAFDGVIGIDVSALTGRIHGSLFSQFVRLFRRTCSHAAVVFFLSGAPGRREEQLAQQILEHIDGIYRVEPAMSRRSADGETAVRQRRAM